MDVVENSKFKNENQINKAAGRAILHKVHNLKYDTQSRSARVWLYQGIGPGKICKFSKDKIEASKAVTKIPFSDESCGEGSVSAERQKSNVKISCPNPLCIKVFNNMDRLEKHIDTGTCQLEETNPPTLKRIRDMWQRRYTAGDNNMVETAGGLQEENDEVDHETLPMGWAIPERTRRVLNERFVLPSNFMK